MPGIRSAQNVVHFGAYLLYTSKELCRPSTVPATMLHVDDLTQFIRWLINMAEAVILSTTHGLQARCDICFEGTSHFRMHTVGACRHRFCLSCMRCHCVSKLQERSFPVPCPHPNCRTGVARAECASILYAPKDLQQLREVWTLQPIRANLKQTTRTAVAACCLSNP